MQELFSWADLYMYQYPFGIRMCSILAKYWKLSEMTKIAYFAHFIEFES